MYPCVSHWVNCKGVCGNAGLSLAPSCVGESLKAGRLLVHCAQMAGITAQPLDSALQRPSMITALELGSEDAMLKFCQMVQVSPHHR